MVYCTKCGNKNEEGAVVCIKCGASLYAAPAWRPGRRRREKEEQECFGLPHGGLVVGIIIGIIVIIIGISQVPGLISPEAREVADELFWPVLMIVFGILIFAGALYQYSRRR